MSTIIACPSCHEDVSLPSRVEGPLICPHCDGEFSITATPANAASGLKNGDAARFAPTTVEVSVDASPAEDEAAPQALPSVEHSVARRRGSASSSSGKKRRPAVEENEVFSDEIPEDDGPENGTPAEEDHEDVDDGGYPVHLDDETSDEESGAGSSLIINTEAENAPSGARAARARKQKSPMGQLLGVFGGGVLGLAIGYYLLNFFGGAQFNFLNLNLPGISNEEPESENEEQSNAGGSRDTSRRADGGTSNGRNDAGRDSRSRSAETDEDPPPFSTTAPFVPPTFSAEELRQTLAGASKAIGCQACQATGVVPKRVFGGDRDGELVDAPCRTCQGSPIAEIDAGDYDALCHLAHVMTWVDRSDPTVRGSDESLRTLLLQSAKTPGLRASLEQLSLSRLAEAAAVDGSGNQARGRLPDGSGIVLLGEVTGREQFSQADETFYVTDLSFSRDVPELGENRVSVVSKGQPAGFVGDQLLIAGAVLRDPHRTMPDWPRQAPFVVLGGMLLVLR